MTENFYIKGLNINIEVKGSGPALVLLHGFTGSAASWREYSPSLAQRYRVIALDALGHGLSDAPDDPSRYAMPYVVADFEAVLDKLGLNQVTLLGYSMGGRMALQIALSLPGRISRLILESASPGLADAAERIARAASDNALAQRLEQAGLAAFVDYWESLPLWASQQRLPDALRQAQHAARLRNNPTGLANSLRGVGTGVQASLWEQLPELTLPTLLIAGELDPKFCAIARQMQSKIPLARLVVVPDAGHTVHLEQPQIFENLVLND